MFIHIESSYTEVFMNIKHIQVTRPEIQSKLFNSVVGKNGKTYFYNGNPTSIWVDDGQDGSAGRTISYEMMDGDTVDLKGPWNTNAKDLLEQTGIDLTKMSYSFGLIFKTRQEALDFQNGKDVEPVHADKEWTLGEFDGGEKRMKEVMDYCGRQDDNDRVSHQIVNVNSLGGVSIMTY